MDKMGGQGSKPEAQLKAGLELFGAGLDLVVAAEDPIRAYAHQLDKLWSKAGSGAAQHGLTGVSTAAEKEARGILIRITKPAVFKGLGVASAAIDMVLNWREAEEDLRKGDRQMSWAHRTVAVGSGLILAASFVNAVGYYLELTAITAAASTLLVVGVVIVAIGFALLLYFNKSAWQKFARHCMFGVESARKGGHGKENWSGGDFSAWDTSITGVDKQLEVLTAMLCSFKVSGEGLADYTIFVEFNAVPPNGKVELNFSYTYENGRAHHPGYLVDLTSEDIAFHGDAHGKPDAVFTREGKGDEKRLVRLRVSAQGPGFQSPVSEARCKVRMLYAPTTGAEVASGQIPIEGACDYLIRNSSWGMAHMEAMDSLKVELEEKEEEKHEEKHPPEGEEIQPGIPM
jgi:hypothetical protein